jgi:hypothetical protein
MHKRDKDPNRSEPLTMAALQNKDKIRRCIHLFYFIYLFIYFLVAAQFDFVDLSAKQLLEMENPEKKYHLLSSNLLSLLVDSRLPSTKDFRN